MLWRTQIWGWILVLLLTQIISSKQTPLLLSVNQGYCYLLHKVITWIKWAKTLVENGSVLPLRTLLSCTSGGDVEWGTESLPEALKSKRKSMMAPTASLLGHPHVCTASVQSISYISKLNHMSVVWEKWFVNSIGDCTLWFYTPFLFSFLMEKGLVTIDQAQSMPIFTKSEASLSIPCQMGSPVLGM